MLAIQTMADELVKNKSLTPMQKLEIQYNINTSISRSRLLLGVLSANISTNTETSCLCGDISQRSTTRTTVMHTIQRSHTQSILSLNDIPTESLIDLSNDAMDFCNHEIHQVSPTTLPINNILKPARSHLEHRNATATQPDTLTVEKPTSEMKRQLLSSIRIESPNVLWDDVVGLETAKHPIRQAVLFPICYPGSLQAKNSWKGILLIGPSGVRKTLLIIAVATEAKNFHFINIIIDNILSKWQSDSEKTVRAIFEIARENSPSIIFIDEIDALCGARGSEESDGSRRLKTALLVEMDGMESGGEGNQVIVIGNTNQPQTLDQAFLSQFSKRIYVPLPDKEGRKSILQKCVNEYKHTLTSNDFDDLALSTHRFSGADLVTLVSCAGLRPLEENLKGMGIQPLSNLPSLENMKPVQMDEFTFALTKTTATNDEALIRKLESWCHKFGDTPAGYYDQYRSTKVSKKFRFFSGLFEFFNGW